MSRFAASVDAAENPGIMSLGDSMHHDSGSNRGGDPPVAERIRPWRVAVVTLCLAVHGCDRGSGGAVELSWSLRPASSPLRNEPFVGCDGAVGSGWGPIAKIRLS